MAPRRTDRSDGESRRRVRGRSVPAKPGTRSGGASTRRTRLSHWRADGVPKTRFPTEAEANRFALQVRLEHGNDLGAYPCELCGGWHLGGRGE